MSGGVERDEDGRPVRWSALFLEGADAGKVRDSVSLVLQVDTGTTMRRGDGIAFFSRAYRFHPIQRSVGTDHRGIALPPEIAHAFWVPVDEKDALGWILAQLLKGFDGRKVQP